MMVDTGAWYGVVPKTIINKIKPKYLGTDCLELGDGSRQKVDIYVVKSNKFGVHDTFYEGSFPLRTFYKYVMFLVTKIILLWRLYK